MANKHITVKNRRGDLETVDLTRVINRIDAVISGNIGHIKLHSLDMDASPIAIATIGAICDGITTSELDNIAAKHAYDRLMENPRVYGEFASRMAISNYEKNCHNFLVKYFRGEIRDEDASSVIDRDNFYYTCRALYENLDNRGNQYPRISPVLMKFVDQNRARINAIFQYRREYDLSYRAYMINMQLYLMKTSVKIGGIRHEVQIERVQHSLMRIAISIVIFGGFIDHNRARTANSEFISKIRHLLDKYELSESEDYETMLYAILSANTYDNEGIADAKEFADILERHTSSWNDYLDRDFGCKLDDRGWTMIADLYEAMSSLKYTHATPTIFNIGTLKPQCSSCYINGPPHDSVCGIMDEFRKESELSKHSGGLGLPFYSIRSVGSIINSTGEPSNGLQSIIKICDLFGSKINQGGKREGSRTCTMTPTHPENLDIIKNRGLEANHQLALNSVTTSQWIPDIFMMRVFEEHKSGIPNWHFIDPNADEVIGHLYDEKFGSGSYSDRYEILTKYMKPVSALKIWNEILLSVVETGLPYILFKDNFNRKNPQGYVIYSSNLCCEIGLHATFRETAVCNLSSICLGEFLSPVPSRDSRYWHEYMGTGFETNINRLITGGGTNMRSRMVYINYSELERVVRLCIRACNRIIDINYYPIPEAKRSNLAFRPIGLGVQDWHRLLMLLLLPFASEAANKLNFYLFEFIYFVALDESCELAREEGAYPRYAKSAYARGKLQHDLWVDEQGERCLKYPLSMPWTGLRERIAKFGVRNSNLIALMPTATTADKTESTCLSKSYGIDPIAGHIIKRKNKGGENTIINAILQDVFADLGKPFPAEAILADPCAGISRLNVPSLVKEVFRTCWEIDPIDQLRAHLIRAPFIDHSSSNNVFMAKPDINLMNAYLFMAWRSGLKTGSYYTRTLPATDAMKLHIVAQQQQTTQQEVSGPICTKEEGCISCN